MKLATKTLFTALATTGLIAGTASTQAATISGTFGTTSVDAVNLSTGGYDDWVVYGDVGTAGSAPASEQMTGASILASSTTNTPDGATTRNPDTNIGITFSWTDGVSGAGSDSTFYKLEDTGNPGSAFTAISSTATGIGTEGTLTLWLGSRNDSTFSLDVEIGTVADPDAYGSSAIGSLTGPVSGNARYLASVDYSGVTDPNAILTWTYTSTDGADPANKLYLGAAAIEVVPEPGSLALLGLGGLLIASRRRRG